MTLSLLLRHDPTLALRLSFVEFLIGQMAFQMTCALGKGLIIGREREATGSGSALRLLLLETSESTCKCMNFLLPLFHTLPYYS